MEPRKHHASLVENKQFPIGFPPHRFPFPCIPVYSGLATASEDCPTRKVMKICECAPLTPFTAPCLLIKPGSS